ncbi:hypothetical protein [Jeongeupia sp. USM3]|uniref:hypothetical protein n=1 Tax=Jeongeupia sp. USM3 TaxID=1906741 RepID=UPI00089E097B|nr:hypothetical protein [Jeongeupia sp. USM3]AOY00082.1 hypothetical protein BJP62_06240 [Jeongeupia sp. USM3]
MKKIGNTLVPRNPFAAAASRRKAGAHEKTEKVRRRDAKQALRQAMQAMKKGGDVFPPFSFA